MCAMKEVTLFSDDAKSKESVKQLMQEIALLSCLRQPNIVWHYGSETITGQSCPLSLKGSPYWMAPEVTQNSNGCNLEVDIWSLGCTVHHPTSVQLSEHPFVKNAAPLEKPVITSEPLEVGNGTVLSTVNMWILVTGGAGFIGSHLVDRLMENEKNEANMRILVTGGAGFIGSHLVDRLMENEKK